MIVTNVLLILVSHLLVVNISIYPLMTKMLVQKTTVIKKKEFGMRREIAMITICVRKIPVIHQLDVVMNKLFVMIKMLVP
jgi:hypothetical protein